MTKRMFDVVVSGVALAVLSPLLLVIAACIWVTTLEPAFFRQQRPGRFGRPFLMFKFRTMREQHDADGKPLPDAARVTRLGRWLRASSLDELPELVNVLTGDMSLVGPRPLLMEYLPLYTPRQRLRHEVRPGITGWAQVNGRNKLSWEEKFELDVWYVEHQTWLLDLRILFMTVMKVLRREGINEPGQVTMSKFQGKPQ